MTLVMTAPVSGLRCIQTAACAVPPAPTGHQTTATQQKCLAFMGCKKNVSRARGKTERALPWGLVHILQVILLSNNEKWILIAPV